MAAPDVPSPGEKEPAEGSREQVEGALRRHRSAGSPPDETEAAQAGPDEGHHDRDEPRG